MARWKRSWVGLVGLALGALAQYEYGGSSSSQGGLAYPEGFRLWAHVKSMIIEPGHPLYESFGGLHHIYVNGVGRPTYLEGKKSPFPDGTVIVFDLLEVRAVDRTLQEGPRKLIGVMVKDRARYGETGGWGYYAFGPNKEALAIDPKACHACHMGAANTDYVFSAFRP